MKRSCPLYASRPWYNHSGKGVEKYPVKTTKNGIKSVTSVTHLWVLPAKWLRIKQLSKLMYP